MQMRGLPTQPAFWPNGLPGPDIENGENPVVITTNQTGYDRDTRYYVQTNGSVDVTIPWVKGLKLTGPASVDKYIKRTKKWESPWYLYTWDKVSYEDDGVTPKLSKGQRGPAEPRLSQGDEDQLNVLLGGILTYERTFNDHALTFLAGTNRETIDNDYFNSYRRFFISSSVDQLIAGGNAEKNANGGGWERARINYFGRVAYNYKEKYLLEFLWRYDGSYMFPESTRYGFFPGVMAGWQISEEDFWKNNVNVVSYFKLRGSWGQLGNDQIYYDVNANGTIDSDELQEYQYLSTNAFRSYIIGGQEVGTIYETRVPNPTVTWEVANNFNLGLEGALLSGKINFQFDVFWNKRSNILWRKNASVPQTTGMTLPAENIGKVNNKGWEFLVGYNGQVGEFTYNVSVNGGYAKNKVIYWDEAPGAPSWQQTTGKPMYTYLAYQYDGVFKTQEDIAAETLDYSAITNTLRPGDMRYKDYNGDGAITPDDRVRNDRTNIPLFQGGLNMGARYKNFDLSILFQGATGAQVYVSTGESGSIGNFLLDVYKNRWTIENPSSEHPRIADRSNQYYSNDNTYWLRSSNYVRLKNIELGYTIPSTLGSRVGISSLRIYVNALNLLTFDKFDVFDPESTGGTGQYYPQAKILNTGLTVTF
jgi:TonB-linked SusC/RagA family outer membrane protein